MKWLSPYQQNSYNEVLGDIGVTVYKTQGSTPIYFNNLSSTSFVAWEVSIDGIVEKPYKSDVWMFEGVCKYSDIKGWDLKKYYSLVVPRDANLLEYYNSNNKRNIKKAIANGLRCERISSNIEIGIACNLFEGNKNLTGGLDVDVFRTLSMKLVELNLAHFHVIKLADKIIAAALSIHSPEVANIRYVASNKEFLGLRPVNFLYDSIIKYYLKIDQNCKFVDLSGIISPDSKDEKLLNITRFKRGFSDLVISFKKM